MRQALPKREWRRWPETAQSRGPVGNPDRRWPERLPSAHLVHGVAAGRHRLEAARAVDGAAGGMEALAHVDCGEGKVQNVSTESAKMILTARQTPAPHTCSAPTARHALPWAQLLVMQRCAQHPLEHSLERCRSAAVSVGSWSFTHVTW